VLAVILAVGSAMAAYAQTGDPSSDAGKQPAAAQDSLRARLKSRGISLAFNYRGEIFYNSGLEPSDTSRYRGLAELSLTFDTEKLALWPGGELFITGQNGHGQNITVNPGGVDLPISNIDAVDFTQISEYGLKQIFLNRRLRLILGKQNVNTYFCVTEFGASFIYPTFQLIPTVPMPTFPAPALGVSAFAEPAKWLSLGAGFYDGGPEVGTLGFDTALKGKGGYFSVFEPEWKPGWGEDGRYAGHYRLGFWYHSGEVSGTGTPPGESSGDYGFYLSADQVVYQERRSDGNNRVLGIFFQFGRAPSDRNQVYQYVGTGCSYKGFLSDRSADTVGWGMNYTRLLASQPAGRKTDLINVELFYEAPLTPWMSLRPDIQYFSNPRESRENGFAAGARWIITF
jgi:porin